MPSFNPQFKIYRANKNDPSKGVAVSVEYNRKNMVFWVAAPQSGEKNGNPTFGWKDKERAITMKMGGVDLGEILACLSGMKHFVGATEKGLYHQNPLGNAGFSMRREGDFFVVRISMKRGGNLVAYNHKITLGEAALLKIFLEACVIKMHSLDVLEVFETDVESE